MSESIYYRTLWTPKLELGWSEEPPRNSTHNCVPNQWITLWSAGVREPNEYPLVVDYMGVETVFNENARMAFLAIAEQKSPEDFTGEDRRRCGEVQGVCAFSNPQGAYGYAIVNLTDVFRLVIVMFKGTVTCRCHEGSSTLASTTESFVVNVTEKLYRHSLEQFIQKHRDELTLQDGGNYQDVRN